MKAVIIGDTHIRLREILSRDDNVEDVLRDKFKQIKELEPDFYIITGDVFDGAKVPNEVLVFARELISGLGAKVYTIIGNHDMISNSIENHERSSLAILEEITENLEILKKPLTIKSTTIHPRHYGDNNFKVNSDSGKDILLMHSMITNTESMFDCIRASDIKTNVDLIISGHNHKKVVYVSDTYNVYNPGALLRLTKADEDRNRAIEVGVLDTETLIIKSVLLNINENAFDSVSEDVRDREFLNEEFKDILEKSTKLKDPRELAFKFASNHTKRVRSKLKELFSNF